MYGKYNNIHRCLGLLTCLLLLSFQTEEAFDRLLLKYQIGFKLPEGYIKQYSENGLLNVQRTIFSASLNIEVRYLIMPVPVDSVQGLHFKKSFQNMVLLLSGGKKSKVVSFTPDAVKKDFNADFGASTIITPVASFAQGYTRCMVMCIQKNKHAQVFVFFLLKESPSLQQKIESAFYAFKFLN